MQSRRAIMILACAALITGCSSARHHTTGISHAEPVDTPPIYGSRDTAHATTIRNVNMPVNPNIRRDVSLESLREHVHRQSAIIVDARQPAEFRKAHVSGAINIPAGEEDGCLVQFQRDVPLDQLVIVYCGGPECPASDNVAAYLSTQGYSNLRVYKPGWQQLSKTDLGG